MRVNFQIDSINSLSDVRDALQKIKSAIEGSALLKGDFTFFEITLNSSVTNFKFSHKLNFTPTDVLQLSVTGSQTITWAYDSFDSTFLVLSSTGPCVVRAYVGRHKEG